MKLIIDIDEEMLTEEEVEECIKLAKTDFSDVTILLETERPQGEKEREFLDRVNISELSNEEKLKLVEQIMPDNKYDEVILAHERVAYERGVADGYAEAIEERGDSE